MRIVYLPLLPIPALAIAVAIGACSAPRDEPPPHVIPPAITLAPPPAAPAPAPARAAQDEPPSADEVSAFERPVPK